MLELARDESLERLWNAVRALSGCQQMDVVGYDHLGMAV